MITLNDKYISKIKKKNINMILIMTSNNGFIFNMFNFALEFVETSKTIKTILITLENKNNITMKSFFLSLILF